MISECHNARPDACTHLRSFPHDEVIHFSEGLRDFAHLVTDPSQVAVVIRDSNDDMVIATAQRAQAAYIVTRDKDLLSLQHHQGITMITPEAFIATVRKQYTRRTEGHIET